MASWPSRKRDTTGKGVIKWHRGSHRRPRRCVVPALCGNIVTIDRQGQGRRPVGEGGEVLAPKLHVERPMGARQNRVARNQAVAEISPTLLLPIECPGSSKGTKRETDRGSLKFEA